MMTSHILQFVDFTATEKSKYLENKTLFFLQINQKFTNISNVSDNFKNFFDTFGFLMVSRGIEAN